MALISLGFQIAIDLEYFNTTDNLIVILQIKILIILQKICVSSVYLIRAASFKRYSYELLSTVFTHNTLHAG